MQRCLARFCVLLLQRFAHYVFNGLGLCLSSATCVSCTLSRGGGVTYDSIALAATSTLIPKPTRPETPPWHLITHIHTALRAILSALVWLLGVGGTPLRLENIRVELPLGLVVTAGAAETTLGALLRARPVSYTHLTLPTIYSV